MSTPPVAFPQIESRTLWVLQEQEEEHDIGELPVIQPKKQRTSIRRATPQVQSMSSSIKRASRDKVRLFAF